MLLGDESPQHDNSKNSANFEMLWAQGKQHPIMAIWHFFTSICYNNDFSARRYMFLIFLE